jgi:hypothetical protein
VRPSRFLAECSRTADCRACARHATDTQGPEGRPTAYGQGDYPMQPYANAPTQSTRPDQGVGTGGVFALVVPEGNVGGETRRSGRVLLLLGKAWS